MKLPQTLHLLSVEKWNEIDNVEYLIFKTDAGIIHARFHAIARATKAVLWVGGIGGGLDGPAGGLYSRLAQRLGKQDISSLRMDYRYPTDLNESIQDAMLVLSYLKKGGYTHVVATGHSAGGAVVITAGALSDNVAGVAALSSQTYGTDLVNRLSPKPLLLIHGTDDEILPDDCSKDLYRRAKEPKEILLYPGCKHGLDECIDALDADLEEWILEVLGTD